MPTTKQRKVVEQLAENSGISLRQAMTNAGYKQSVANSPDKLTNSMGFKELLAEMGIDDVDLAQVLKQGLHATKTITSPTEPDSIVADYQTRHKYLETGLRLRGYAREQSNNINIVVPILGGMSKNVPSDDSDIQASQTKTEN